MAQLLLGIDIGTYSSKGVLARPAATTRAAARPDHDMSIPKPGWAEHDADGVWWADFVSIAKDLTGRLPQGDRIGAVALSAIGACLLPVDEAGRPLRAGILYGVDTRAMEQIDQLEEIYGRQALVELGGMRLTTQAVGPKILWLKQNEPDVYNAAFKFLTATSYIIYKLTGEYVIERHTASEFNPLINIHSGEWDERFAGEICPLDKLPRLGWSDEIAGRVSAEAAELTGLLEGTPVTFGAVDALSEAISVGVASPGELMIMYGSTAFFILVIEKPTPSDELWLDMGAFKGTYVYAAGLSTSGSATTWFRDQFAKDLIREQQGGGDNAYAELAREAAQSPAGANGLLMLPYLSGERTPIFDPLARGVFAGLGLNHTRGDMYRAVLEGTAYAIRHNLEAMQAAGTPFKHGVAVGGGTQNDLWLQMVSDISGIPQIVPEKTIGASYGDAYLAGMAIGAVEGLDPLKNQWVHIAKEIQPNPALKPVYERHYQLFRQLYPQTKEISHVLAQMQEEQL
jgi:xylulokinase